MHAEKEKKNPTEKSKPSFIRIHGETLRSDSQFKTLFVTDNTTCEEAVQLALKKYKITDEPSEFGLYQEKDTGEIEPLPDDAILLKVVASWGADDFHYRFSIRRKPEALKRKEGLLLKYNTKKVFSFTVRSWVPRRMVVDAEEKFIAYYRHDKDYDPRIDPLSVIYNLKMVSDVYEVTNDPDAGIFEFAIIYRNEKHLLRAENNEEMTSWINIVEGACTNYADLLQTAGILAEMGDLLGDDPLGDDPTS
eukprot:NODE_624_length_1318_cov_53.382032_g585_i0.p1 GENE.NODE_624_length_1318_cov_53.382032_g585_i0~~NODE_624_length_1318_cov_53.382032_g585_i0.p1  ORF type:complete len:249 (-),score=39.35 NODE_624_length_1318_cov_53.382032_g585_i0:115-861(-)